MSGHTPQPDIFYQIKNRARGTAAMLAGMQLELFTPLDGGALSVEQLAGRIEVNATKWDPFYTPWCMRIYFKKKMVISQIRRKPLSI